MNTKPNNDYNRLIALNFIEDCNMYKKIYKYNRRKFFIVLFDRYKECSKLCDSVFYQNIINKKFETEIFHIII